MNTQSQFETERRPKPGKQYFSLAEANAALPYVSRVVTDIRDSYRRAYELQQQLEHPMPGDNAEAIHEEYDGAVEKLQRCVEELKAVGVDLKDHEQGLVDFPAIHEGREVLLCWKCGEQRVDHWHEVDAGFAGRQDAALLG